MRLLPTLSRQDGGSVVEYALMAPLFVTMSLWAIYLLEIGTAKIKQQEVTRFAVWEFTAYPLSDWKDANHQAKFDAARTEILDETFDRYKDLAGHNKGQESGFGMVSRAYIGMGTGGAGQNGNAAGNPTAGAITLSPVPLDLPGQVTGGGGGMAAQVMELLSALGDALNTVLRLAFAFNTESAGARANVGIRIDNRLMPRNFLDDSWFQSAMLPDGFNPLLMPGVDMTLMVDHWYMNDGRDVHLPGGDGGNGYLYWKQVQRMHLGGAIRERIMGPFGDVLTKIEQFFPLRLPTEAQLVSQNYRSSGDLSAMSCPSGGSGPLTNSGKWVNHAGFGYQGNTETDDMSGVKCFDTLPIRANGMGYASDPNHQTLSVRRDNYMGCDRSQRRYPDECQD